MLEAAGGRQFHGTILQCPSAVEAKQLMSQDSRSYSLLKVIMCNSSIFTRIYSRDLKWMITVASWNICFPTMWLKENVCISLTVFLLKSNKFQGKMLLLYFSIGKGKFERISVKLYICSIRWKAIVLGQKTKKIVITHPLMCFYLKEGKWDVCSIFLFMIV